MAGSFATRNQALLLAVWLVVHSFRAYDVVSETLMLSSYIAKNLLLATYLNFILMPHRNRESNFEDYSSYRGDGFIHVGRYKFNMKDKIGHGSYATVYKGSVKTKSGKPLIVAIKEMDIALTPLKEMKKEVRILKVSIHVIH